MEISLFARCLKELVAENDEVAVPHLGLFSVELMPATFSDNLSTINPPYRKVSFRKCVVTPADAAVVVRKVADTMGVNIDQAMVEIDWCLSRQASELESSKNCELPGFGKMKSNSTNDFFFVPDDDLDIYPEGLGFEAIHLRIAPDVIAEPQAGLAAELKEEPKAEQAVEQPAEQAVEPAAEPKVEPANKTVKQQAKKPVAEKSKPKVWLVVLIAIALVVIVCIVLSILYPQQASELLDKILYTEEELDLIRGNW